MKYTPDDDEIARHNLRARIAAIGAVIDMFYGNTTPRAERAIYFWHWPPEDHRPDFDTLQALHRDALGFLRDALDAQPDCAPPEEAA